MPFLQLLSAQGQTGRLLTCVEAQEEHVLTLKPLHVFFFVFFFKCHCPARSDKCSAPRLLPLQWQSLIQDLQAEEEHPRGLPPVRAAETCRGDAGQWEPAAGCHAARGRGSQWVDCCQQWVNECKAPIYRNHRSVWPQLPFEVSKHEWAFVQRLNICIIKLKCQYLPTSYWKTSVCIWELHHLVCYCYEHEHSLTTETIINLRFFSAVDFFNQINMLYGTITEFCTETSCSVMSAGPR